MSQNKCQDGGYYAIKGFFYQADKTILEILKNPNQEICFEQDQDINFDDLVIQVKYREKTGYSPSKIKEPIIQLIGLFEQDQSKKYFLYCYFNNRKQESKVLTLEELNEILGEEHFEDNLKQSFIKNFKLNFSHDFDEHFENVIKEIKSAFSTINSNQEAIIAHGVILDHIFQKIVNNPIEYLENRKVSKQELEGILEANKKCTFYSAYRNFISDKKYFALIKNMYFTWRNIDNYERFIIVDLCGNESLADIKEMVLKIKKTFYCRQKRTLKSGAPFLHLRNISDELLVSLKEQFINDGYLLKDGYDFHGSSFCKKYLLEPSTLENCICLKFLNTQNELLDLLDENFNRTKEVYHFFLNSPLDLDVDFKNVKIQIKGIIDLNFIL